jgi:uncharacterized protein (TIGR02147 family)
MATIEQKPDLFAYFDFRKYLSDMLAYFRTRDESFTFQQLVDKYNLTSRSHYLDILNGRKLTRKFIPFYVKICELNEKEADYFRALIEYNQSKSPDEKKKLFHIIKNTSPDLETIRLENEVYDYFKHWYIPALLSILDLDKKERDHLVLAKKFNPEIPAVEGRKALKLLQKLGFISWNSELEEWTFHHKFFKCSEEARATALKSFHSEIFHLGLKAYENNFKEQTFSTLTVSIDEKLYIEIEDMISELRKKIMEKVKRNEISDRVLQINFQTFLLSQLRRRNKNGEV